LLPQSALQCFYPHVTTPVPDPFPPPAIHLRTKGWLRTVSLKPVDLDF
jgi:hypothetical protein